MQLKKGNKNSQIHIYERVTHITHFCKFCNTNYESKDLVGG